MPWQNQSGGGGPWGGGGSGGGGPWGRGPSGQRPPDLEELLRRSQDRMKSYIPGGFGSARGIIIIALLVITGWMVTGFYTVQPDEVGIPLVFGKARDKTLPGVHWNAPAPIGHVEKPKVTAINKVEIGGHDSSGGSDAQLAESLMLTGDANIIEIQSNVQWQISDPYLYLFNIREPDITIKSAAEAALREIVGQTQFEYALQKDGRAEIEDRSKELIQRILDSYGAGIIVTQVALQNVGPPSQVVDAFRDVQAAGADRVTANNEAQKYYNTVTEGAKGQAQQTIKDAEAYKEQKIALATGDAQRFLSVYNQYKLAKEITQRRIYLETMEQIMQRMRKILIEPSVGTGAVPYLPLDQLLRQPPPTTPASPEAPNTAGASQ
jgi:modulator of FtsH protease HflK